MAKVKEPAPQSLTWISFRLSLSLIHHPHIKQKKSCLQLLFTLMIFKGSNVPIDPAVVAAQKRAAILVDLVFNGPTAT